MSVQTVKHKPYLIGLTGGIASGKSTASNTFKSLGIPVIDSDEIVSNLWKQDIDMVKEIEEAFGYSMDGKGKKQLAIDIFQDDLKRAKLNRIVHPKVFYQIEELKKQYANEPYLVIDMPLLLEVGYQKQVDIVCLVYVDQETQLKRLINRDQLAYEDAYMRINSQMSLEEKKSLSDVIFDNTGSIEYLKTSIKDFLKHLEDEE
ncbi:MAG: dephospho-CoA kinase [Acholeplasmataceae bacterium]|jgi:dephospho-CoA kinase|nr:dephospho-CoA kinase [Acholeplasmataceae bacterium]